MLVGFPYSGDHIPYLLLFIQSQDLDRFLLRLEKRRRDAVCEVKFDTLYAIAFGPRDCELTKLDHLVELQVFEVFLCGPSEVDVWDRPSLTKEGELVNFERDFPCWNDWYRFRIIQERVWL